MFKIMNNKLKDEIVFTAVFILTLITSFFAKPDIFDIDLKVIASLFNLMIISLVLEDQLLLDKIALTVLGRYKTTRNITLAMIITTALLGMLITNDVALITVVPLTIIIAKRGSFNPYKIIVLETIAANIGSSLTPFGNPQNLYLYSFYKIQTSEFFNTMLPFVIAGLFLLIIASFFTENRRLQYDVDNIKIKNPGKLMIYMLLFILVLLSIIRIVDYKTVFLIILVLVTIMDIKLFLRVDYFLLGTFVFFFLLIGNITRMGVIQNFIGIFLKTPLETMITSSILSQVISNVPSAILLSAFTTNHRALLLGVSIGGLGTMIASLANLISFKLYQREYDGRIYKKFFYRLNITLGLLILAYGMLIIKY